MNILIYLNEVRFNNIDTYIRRTNIHNTTYITSETTADLKIMTELHDVDIFCANRHSM